MFDVDGDVFESVGQLSGTWGKLFKDIGGQVYDEGGIEQLRRRLSQPS